MIAVDKPKCKRCLIENEISRNIAELVELMPEERKTHPEIYSIRLSICRTCPNLTKGTCIKCGCYVEMRAAKPHMECPISLWKKV